jgi:hypothetical protein
MFKTTLVGSLLVALVGAATPLWAQTAAAPQTPPAATNPASPAAGAPARVAPNESSRGAEPSSRNQLIERIRVDSGDVRIDEVRFGGETRSISVAPKGGFPTYDVQPTTGERTWKILGF